MMQNIDVAALHDKATRGGALSPEEQASLDAWYAAEDAGEARALRHANGASPATVLDAAITRATADIAALAADIQSLATQNAALRQEIRTLQEELAKRASRVA